MNFLKNIVIGLVIMGCMAMFSAGYAQESKAPAIDPEKALLESDEAAWKEAETNMMASDWRFHNIADVNDVKQYAKFPAAEGVLIIDSRPYLPKYVKGHIPNAISIPESKFNDMAKLLPEDKNTILIFYCGGFECRLSHKSAKLAEELGYKNAKVFAAGYPGWLKAGGNYSVVGIEYVEQEMDDNKMMLIDSRPKKAKFDKGHIPTAVSLPDAEFDALKGKLPRDPDTLLIFYCEGFDCKLSHQSAAKALGLGYTDVKVFAAGYPAWKEKFGDSSAAPAPKTPKDQGMLKVEDFQKIIAENPDSVLLIDTRDKDEFEKGHFRTAVNMTVDQIEKNVKTLPSDKMIVFVCSTGARSGEAYYMIQDLRPELKNVWYVDAGIKFDKDGNFTIIKPK